MDGYENLQNHDHSGPRCPYDVLANWVTVQLYQTKSSHDIGHIALVGWCDDIVFP